MTMKPGRRSMTATSKRPPASEPRVDGELLLDQELGIRTALGCTDLDDDAV
jgi:hypothetical protein